MSKIRKVAIRLTGWSSLTASSRAVFRNMVTLMAGAVGAKIIGLLSLPIITRIYLPEHFGVFAIYSSLVGILVPLATLKYEIAIPVPKRNTVAFNHLVLCFAILLSTTTLITITLWLFSHRVFAVFDLQALTEFWWLVPVGILGSGTYTILTLWGTRTKQFQVIAKTTLTQSVFGAVFKIGLAFVLMKPLGLLVGQVIHQSAGITSFIRAFNKSFITYKLSVTLNMMKFTANYFSSIPRYRLPSQVILLFSSSAPVFYSAYVFGTDTTGQIGLASSMIALPMGIIGNSIGKAYFAEASSMGRKNAVKVKQLTKSVTKQLFFISVLPAFVLIIFGDSLFEFVFGERWSQAGVFAGILSIFLVFQFISSPLVNVLTVFNRQDLFLKINIVRLTLLVAVFGTSYLLDLDAIQTFWIYSLTLSVHYLITLKTIYKAIK